MQERKKGLGPIGDFEIRLRLVRRGRSTVLYEDHEDWLVKHARFWWSRDSTHVAAFVCNQFTSRPLVLGYRITDTGVEDSRVAVSRMRQWLAAEVDLAPDAEFTALAERVCEPEAWRPWAPPDGLQGPPRKKPAH